VAPAGRTIEGTLATPDGRERTYRVYVPASLVPGVPVPLLVAMHGGLGSAAQFQDNSGFDGVAEANGFVIAYPDGIGSPVKAGFAQTWNGGYCCGPAVVQGVDDVAFLRQLVAELQRTYVIDPARIYAAGHSNGGIMAYRLACEAADVFAGIGLQASSLGVEPCDPTEPVSLVHVHGLADRNHPIDGGAGDGVANVVFHPALDGVRTIASADDCPAEPATTAHPTNPDVTVETWAPCAEGTEVELVKVAGASHAWMGGTPRPIQRALVGETYDRYSSAAAIWAFLAAHPRP
jgi:polyhydroxybutyrate depolymerase